MGRLYRCSQDVAEVLVWLAESPTQERVLRAIANGQYPQALNASGSPTNESRGAAALLALEQADQLLEGPESVLGDVQALALAQFCQCVHRSANAGTLGALLFRRRIHVAATSKYFDELRKHTTTGDDPLPAAEWDTLTVWVDHASPSDALLAWYVERTAKLPFATFAYLFDRDVPDNVQLLPTRTRKIADNGLCADEITELCRTGIYREGTPADALEQLTIADIRNFIKSKGLAITAKKKAELIGRLAEVVPENDLRRLMAANRLRPSYVSRLDEPRRDHLVRLQEAATVEADLVLEMMYTLYESFEQYMNASSLDGKAFISPGPDSDCRLCPSRPVGLKQRNQAVPPFHPGCRCRVEVDWR